MDQSEVPKEFTIGGILIHGGYTEENINKTTNFQSREGDVFLATYPRSGTTWTQNIILGMKYGNSYLESANGNPCIDLHFPYLELPLSKAGYEVANEMNYAPRFLKTHLPPHLAPKQIFSSRRKTVVVVRNPKDTALSLRKFYDNCTFLHPFNTYKNLEDFLDHFLQGKVFYGNWWDWNKAWIDLAKKSDHMHLIHYENLHDNFDWEIHRLASFLNFDPLGDEAMGRLKQLVSVGEMKARYAYSTIVKDFVDKGLKEAWKTEIPQDYVDRFDYLTQKYFDDDELLAKFL